MAYMVRPAEQRDLNRIEAIYAHARRFMAENGNPNQWGTTHPPRDLLLADIGSADLYVILDGTDIHGVFYFRIGADPTYAEIYDGAWRSTAPYGTIHRIAGDGSGGILKTAVEYARTQVGHLRIDTHEDNWVMQKAVEKQGFQRCGIVYVEDGTPRIAYDWLRIGNTADQKTSL